MQIIIRSVASVYECICMPVCMSVCRVCSLTFESLDLEIALFGIQVHLQNIQIKFVYPGHQFKVKVRGPQKEIEERN